jgi:hypothetical protein
MQTRFGLLPNTAAKAATRHFKGVVGGHGDAGVESVEVDAGGREAEVVFLCRCGSLRSVDD